MYKFIKFFQFSKEIFDNTSATKKASKIMEGILEARSPRISDIADKMPGSQEASYKEVQRFLEEEEPREVLKRLFNDLSEYVLVDPTEIEMPGAKKTEYVGTLSDGKTRGLWMLTLATPIRGRAIPCHFITYSSATLSSEATSRNLEHQRAIQNTKQLIGNRTLVFDREFSYLNFLNELKAEEINFVIRLNMGSKPPKFYLDNEKKRELKLYVAKGKGPKTYHQVYYQGIVPVNVIGVWKTGFKSPLWIMTSLEPEHAVSIYKKRMKIEVSFRDMKNLLHMDKVMYKTRNNLEKMLAMVHITYAISLLVGEGIRDVTYAGIDPETIDLYTHPEIPRNSKWYSFSGLFLLIMRRRRLKTSVLRGIVKSVLVIFSERVFGKNVRSFVQT